MVRFEPHVHQQYLGEATWLSMVWAVYIHHLPSTQTLIGLDRKSMGAGDIEAPKATLTDDAKACTLEEMGGRTGETDSEGRSRY